jgi:hypothetical protein
MKTIIIAMSIAGACGCRVEKDIQVEFVKTELIRIDTIRRYPKDVKLLTWQDDRNIRYTSYITLERHLPVGTQMLVMRRR